MNTAYLLTENGTLLKGKSFGAQGTSLGELCFNTGMTGYQEVFSDPSYYGQTIIMTSPHIGNYGNHEKEFQSKGFQAAGLVCGFIADVASRKGSDVQHLDDRLKESGIVGIQGLDTRQLVQEVRDKGARTFEKSALHETCRIGFQSFYRITLRFWIGSRRKS